MADKNNDGAEECEGTKMQRRTDRDIKEIRTLMTEVVSDSNVNKTSIEFMSKSYSELAKSNSLTHYKLFARTEDLNIKVAECKAAYKTNEKHGTKEDAKQHGRRVFFISCVAIILSVATVILLAIQAGIFN